MHWVQVCPDSFPTAHHSTVSATRPPIQIVKSANCSWVQNGDLTRPDLSELACFGGCSQKPRTGKWRFISSSNHMVSQEINHPTIQKTQPGAAEHVGEESLGESDQEPMVGATTASTKATTTTKTTTMATTRATNYLVKIISRNQCFLPWSFLPTHAMLPGPASMDGGEPRCAKKIGENKNIVPVPESSPAAESAETSKRFDPKGRLKKKVWQTLKASKVIKAPNSQRFKRIKP